MALAVTGQRLGLLGNHGMKLGAAARATLPCALTLAAIVVPSVILSLLYCRLARRTVIGRSGWSCHVEHGRHRRSDILSSDPLWHSWGMG